MKFPPNRSILLLFATLVSGFQETAAAPKEKLIIVAQPNSAVEVSLYTAFYSGGDTRSQPGISHSLQYRNRGTQKIVAVSFSFVCFDVFNRYLTTSGGISMDDLVPEKKERGSWRFNSYGSFSFLSGVVYVNLIRFDDGTIWQADEPTVLAEIRKIEKDFDAKLLKEKVEPGR
jgi:hypothetical protein